MKASRDWDEVISLSSSPFNLVGSPSRYCGKMDILMHHSNIRSMDTLAWLMYSCLTLKLYQVNKDDQTFETHNK